MIKEEMETLNEGFKLSVIATLRELPADIIRLGKGELTDLDKTDLKQAATRLKGSLNKIGIKF